jgi:Flp pilus assembly protein TadG
MIGRRDERGAMAIELVILTPALVAAIMVIAAGGRYVDARGQATSAAFAAARAASLSTSQPAAVAAGTRAAERSIAERGHACARLEVTIDAHDFAPGGAVHARVTCTADLSDLGLPLPGPKTFTAAATAPLEQHRDFRAAAN